eukprot:871099-Pelagomonas_calceolata.AAC.2
MLCCKGSGSLDCLTHEWQNIAGMADYAFRVEHAPRPALHPSEMANWQGLLSAPIQLCACSYPSSIASRMSFC